MELISGIAAWFADPAHWQGPAGVPTRIVEHLVISGAALLLAAVIGLAAGIATGHSGRGATLAINLANLGRALPTFGVMAVVLPLTVAIDNDAGFKVYPAIVGLIILAVPPILVNAHAGVSGVDREAVETAWAMGMRAGQVLWRVELPLALPVILTGLRSAASQVLATATLAALFGGPGLGRYLVEGYAQLDYPMMFAGVILVGLLFVAVEGLFALKQRMTAKPGLRPPDRDLRTQVVAPA